MSLGLGLRTALLALRISMQGRSANLVKDYRGKTNGKADET